MLLTRSSCRQRCMRPVNALRTATKTTTKTPVGAKTTNSKRKQGSQNLRSKESSNLVTDSGALGLQYLASSAVAASLGAALTLAPHQVIELLGGYDVLNFTEMSAQVYGAYWVLVAAAAYRLSQAADKGLLSSSTYCRLNLYLSLFLGASATSLLAGAAAGDLAAAPAGAAAAAALGATAITFLPGWLAAARASTTTITDRQSDTTSTSSNIAGDLLAQTAAGFGSGLKSSFKAGRGLVGAFYSLSFYEAFILGIALLFGPILPTVAQDVTGTSIVVKNLVGVGTLLYGGVVWLLLDASDRDRLGAATFRALNTAAGVVSLIVAAVCVAGQANGVATNLTNQAVVIVSCGLTASAFLGLAAKPPTQE